MSMTPFTKKQRMKIYKKALAHFVRTNKPEPSQMVGTAWRNRTEGMCVSLEHAVSQLQYGWYGYQKRSMHRETFPEYYAFKPKTTWKADSNYWYTRYFQRGGYSKRVAILTAIVNGQTVEQFKKERDASK